VSWRDSSGTVSEIFLHFILFFGVFAFACTEPWSVAILQFLIAVLCIGIQSIINFPLRIPAIATA